MDAAPLSDTAPLSDIRVLEFGHYIAGPFCSQILADQGADVIKVEPPEGDASRSTVPLSYNDVYFHALNRNKRSVMLDLKSESGQESLVPLLRTADVLVTNYAVGIPERLGFGYEQVREINAGLVYVHASGFGNDSPYARRPAFDGIIQAMSGLVHLTGEPDGMPMQAGLFVPDHVTGLYAALAVMFGLTRRQSTGEGSFTDLSMLDSMMSLLGPCLAESLQLGVSPMRVGSKVRRSYAGTYTAADGYVYLAPMTLRMWTALAGVVDAPQLLPYFTDADTDTRLEHRDELDRVIEAWTRAHPVAEVVARMGEVGVPSSPIFSVDALAADPHVRHRGMVRSIPMESGSGEVIVPGSPLPVVDSAFASGPPSIGAHTEEILGVDPSDPVRHPA
ncbi:CoA:oxalate CoA-transferase [Actinomadura pelletieri DSM 43383]|uniref:CoA:oxalate CoA-transferase n=1 Tax=Actinomadura pelletieri DSM 43383 TaxID=1120940 RepID=A0A495QAM2_9ACTN|nr:CoA transferase [Actinomadura pelletieri]RKS68374.1 CoA:oxalate CoA-transferase [Actinomadura pelletieri DSM 43383]